MKVDDREVLVVGRCSLFGGKKHGVLKKFTQKAEQPPTNIEQRFSSVNQYGCLKKFITVMHTIYKPLKQTCLLSILITNRMK